MVPDKVLRGADLVEGHKDKGLHKEAERQVLPVEYDDSGQQQHLWNKGERCKG